MAATELLHLMNNHVESNPKANEHFYGLLDVEGLARVDALIDLCFRPYWSRLWVIQEFTLAPTVTIQCGSASLALKTLSDVLLHESFSLLPWPDLENSNTLRYSNAMKLLSFRRGLSGSVLPWYLGNGYHSLADVMRAAPRCYCDDLRDKIFGLLSLSPACCKLAIRPNYSQSLVEVSEDVLDHHTQEHSEKAYQVLNGIFEGLGLNYWKGNPPPQPPVLPAPVGSLRRAKGSEISTQGGKCRGQIVWIFEPPGGYKRCDRQKKPLNIPPMPNIDAKIRLLLLSLATSKKITSRLSSFKPVEGGRFYFNPESDFLSIRKPFLSYVTKPPKCCCRMKEKDAKGSFSYKPPNETTLSLPGAEDEARIQRLWRAWQKILVKGADILEYQRLSVFFTDDGALGFGTRGCKVGDMLCEFGPGKLWPTKVAIFNHSGSRHQIIGKGILVRRKGWKDEMPTGNFDLKMHLDLATLLFLKFYF